MTKAKIPGKLDKHDSMLRQRDDTHDDKEVKMSVTRSLAMLLEVFEALEYLTIRARLPTISASSSPVSNYTSLNIGLEGAIVLRNINSRAIQKSLASPDYIEALQWYVRMGI